MHVQIHESAERDLEELYEKDPDAAAEIEVLLEILQENEVLASHLGEYYRNYIHPDFDVGAYVELFQKGIPIYRLKYFDAKGELLPYRIIHVCSFRNDVAYIMAIVHRSFNYDIKHPIVKRILSDCKAIGLYTD